MKKTLIATAVAASVIAPISAYAVNASFNDAGEMLLYPYYNVNDGNKTFIGVVNTTAQTKVLKVRFREGVESEDVFDFQLWLSPRDHWTAVLQVINGKVRVSTADNSCTVPTVKDNTGANFITDRIPAAYTGDVLQRISEGHVEIIEMAEVAVGAVTPTAANDLATAVKHNTAGVPANCATAQAFNTGGGTIFTPGVTTKNNVAGDFSEPAGGVYGIAAVYNPTDGTYFTYTAEALEEFAATPIFFTQVNTLCSNCGDFSADIFLPLFSVQNLASRDVLTFDLPDISTPDGVEAAGNATINSYVYTGANTISTGTYNTNAIVAGGPVVGSDAADKKADAVTTALMANRVNNDYLTGTGYDTDWVFTFPGRYAHRRTPVFDVNANLVGYRLSPPFTQSTVLRTNGEACNVVGTTIWDREEKPADPADIGFSPGTSTTFELCYEVNVIAMNDDAGTAGTAALRSISVRRDADVPFDFGWGDLTFNGATQVLVDDAPAPVSHQGLPFIGFAAITDRSTVVRRGGTFMHKITRGQ